MFAYRATRIAGRLIACAAVMFLVWPCRADAIKFLAVNGAYAGGIYVAPYTVSFEGSQVDVMCLDADRHVNFNDVWDVQVHHVGDAGLDFAIAPEAEQRYKTAAVLWTWLQDGVVSKAAASYAVWNLFRPGFSMSPVGSEAALSQTAAWNFVQQHTGLSYSGVSFLTPTSHGPHGNQYQEFITGRVAATPEPGTFLLGAGALLLVGVRCFGRKPARR